MWVLLARVTAARWALARHIKQPAPIAPGSDIRYHTGFTVDFCGCLMLCALSRFRRMKDINECCEWNCVYQQRINAYCIAMNVIMCEHYYNCTQHCTARRQPRETMPIDNNREHNTNHKFHLLQNINFNMCVAPNILLRTTKSAAISTRLILDCFAQTSR